MSVSADDMILYVDNPKDTTKKLLELANEFSKVTGYKINMQKSVVFLYTNNKISEREIKKAIIYNCFKKNKISRIKFKQRDKRLVLKKL